MGHQTQVKRLLNHKQKQFFCSICGKEDWIVTTPGHLALTDLQICSTCWPEYKDMTVQEYYAIRRLNNLN